MRWLKTHNPYYADVAIDRSRLDFIPEGAEIPGVQDCKHIGTPPLEGKGPAADQAKAGRDAAEAAYETCGVLLPEVAPDFRDEVRKLLETAHGQNDRGGDT